MTVDHGFMFGVSIVDTAGAAMSEAREWLRGTPTSATMTLSTIQRERENAAEIGREIEFLTVDAGVLSRTNTSCRPDISYLN